MSKSVIILIFHLTFYYKYDCYISALTGKVDKEKQKRDQDIINAARDNNIFNLSRKPSPGASPNYFPQRSIIIFNLQKTF